MPATLEANFLTPLDGDQPALLFRKLVAREELGRLPEYGVELLRPREKAPVTADQLLGAQVDLKIQVYKEKFRFINGFVSRFERGGITGDYDIYRVEVKTWLWQLTLGSDCRIFQDKTAIEVIEAVFADYAAAGTVKKDQLNGGTAKRPFTVQYNESDFNFVMRLMEEEGIYFYFTHTQGQHTLVLTDKSSGHNALPDSTLRWSDAQVGADLAVDLVTHWSSTHAVGSTKYVHTDFAAEKPALDLKTQASRTPPHPKHPQALEVFEYPGGYTDISMDEQPDPKKTVGTTRAQMQVDRFESGRVSAVGITPYRFSAAGATFTLSGHPADDGDYLITAVDYEMVFSHYEAKDSEEKTGFACRFKVVPKATPFHTLPIAHRPRIYGPQTATVVGTSGDEITTDKYGRAKLQFRWDRLGSSNENSSCWVRISQPWAGKQFGMIALPRIGDEVVVEFLDGNPDRPLITGRVYNGDNMPPYKLPDQATVSGIKTQSSKGGGLTDANELRFDDKKGSEYIWLQAQKDMFSWVKNDRFSSVLNNYWGDVTKNYSLKIGGTTDLAIADVTKVKVDKDLNVKLGADMHMAITGALGLEVTDAVAVKGSKAIAVTSGAAMDLKVGQTLNMTATSAVSLKGMSITIEGESQITIKAGAGTITLGPAGVTIDGPTVKINCGGGGGSATAAAEASPPAPQEPPAPTNNKDPLAQASGGSGAGA
jgi:type VI secretion system secreted protein VgrG